MFPNVWATFIKKLFPTQSGHTEVNKYPKKCHHLCMPLAKISFLA